MPQLRQLGAHHAMAADVTQRVDVTLACVRNRTTGKLLIDKNTAIIVLIIHRKFCTKNNFNQLKILQLK